VQQWEYNIKANPAILGFQGRKIKI
jgi:hypothetical protein